MQPTPLLTLRNAASTAYARLSLARATLREHPASLDGTRRDMRIAADTILNALAAIEEPTPPRVHPIHPDSPDQQDPS